MKPRAITDLHEYGLRLSDGTYWRPVLEAVAARHGLPREELTPGVRGTYPTFAGGDYVFKLFGPLFDGLTAHQVELAVYQLLETVPDLPVARLVGTGEIDGCDTVWRYLILSRVRGTAWCSADMANCDGRAAVVSLGQSVRLLHNLVVPAEALPAGVNPSTSIEDVLARHRRWATLPSRLIDQIPQYVRPLQGEPRLVHADLHADHIFLDGDRLTGIIDWSDAHLQDAYMELPALHLGCFSGNKALLKAFLDGYAWNDRGDFARRAMSATLMHEFDVLAGAAPLRHPRYTGDLEDLEQAIWGI